MSHTRMGTGASYDGHSIEVLETEWWGWVALIRDENDTLYLAGAPQDTEADAFTLACERVNEMRKAKKRGKNVGGGYKMNKGDLVRRSRRRRERMEEGEG